MRCSDCKFFKTDDCKVNPEGENCSSAEIFACFKSSADDEVQEVSTKTSRGKKQTVGSGMFWIGTATLLIVLAIAISLPKNIEYIGEGIALFIVMVICALLAVIGALMFIVGWSEGRIRRYNREAGDSKSDYNKTIDKS